MSVCILKRDENVETEQNRTVTQFWICQEVDFFRQGHHVYEINETKYVVKAYCSEKRVAVGMCASGNKIAIVEVHDYKEEDRLADKKSWTFSAWILPYKRKRLG